MIIIFPFKKSSLPLQKRKNFYKNMCLQKTLFLLKEAFHPRKIFFSGNNIFLRQNTFFFSKNIFLRKKIFP